MLTHAHTFAPITQHLFSSPRASTHTLTLSSPCSHSYTVRGYRQTMLCSSWLGAGSNHTKGWCVSLHSAILHSPAFSWYTAVLVLVITEGRGWRRERTGRCRVRTGRRRQRAGDAGMRRRTRAKAERRSEQERSSLRRSSAPFIKLVPPRARRCTTNSFLLVLFFGFLFLLVLIVRRASSARASERGNFGSERGR